MMLASVIVRPASTSTGKRFSGHSVANSYITCGFSLDSSAHPFVWQELPNHRRPRGAGIPMIGCIECFSQRVR
jgi:hypothetical protein